MTKTSLIYAALRYFFTGRRTVACGRFHKMLSDYRDGGNWKATVGAYSSLDDLVNTSGVERDHLYHLLLTAKGSWGRVRRKMLDTRAGQKAEQRPRGWHLCQDQQEPRP